MTSTVAKSIQACSTLLLVLVGLVGLVGCGEESPPAMEDLTLREMLGIHPDRMADLPSDERAAIVDAIEAAWTEAIEAPSEPVNVTVAAEPITAEQPSSPPISFVRTFDAERLQRGLDVQVSARIDAAGTRAEIRPTTIPVELLGMSFDGNDGVSIEALSVDEPRHEGALYWDDAFGAVESEAFGGRTELEAARRLEPALRRYLYQMGLTSESARVERAEQAPLVLWYATGHRAVFVNPNLLHLLESSESSVDSGTSVRDLSGQFVTIGQPLAPAYIESCASEQQRRCSQCFGPAGNPSSSVCNPLFPVPAGTDPATQARQECDALADDAGAGFELFCYHQEIMNNLGCFYSRDVLSECGAEGLPLGTVPALAQLGPMRDESRPCQGYLTGCRDDRITNPDPTPDDPPPSTDETDSVAAEIGSFGDCVGATCEILGAGCAEGEGGDGGGLCEGDGLDGAASCGSGLCDGDGDDGGSEDTSGGADTATASMLSANQMRATGLVLGMPALFLLGLAWWARRREPDSTQGDTSNVARCASDPAGRCGLGAEAQALHTRYGEPSDRSQCRGCRITR